jgi:hypothetical protein
MNVLPFRGRGHDRAADPGSQPRRLTPVPAISDPSPGYRAMQRLAVIEDQLAEVTWKIDQALLLLSGHAAGTDPSQEPAVTTGELEPTETFTPDFAETGARPRPYAPYPVLPQIEDDLGALPVFRATVHAEIVRRDGAQGIRQHGLSWRDAWAAALERRTGPVAYPVPGVDVLIAVHFGAGTGATA